MYVGRNVKIWIFITLCSMLVWTIYWMPWSFSLIYDSIFSQNSIFRFGGWLYLTQELSGAVGTIIRSVGLFIGLFVLFLLRNGSKGIFETRKWIASALAIESIYYALLGFPSGIYMMSFGDSGQYRVLGVSFLLQFLFATPLLAVLAVKVYSYKNDGIGFQSWKWVGAAFIGYLAALWANTVPKWFEMLSMEGITFFSVPIRTIGMLNDFLLMSLAIVFAVVGAFSLVKKKSSAMRWLGLSLAVVGLHYLIYVVYSYYGGMLNSVMMAEVWAIPLLGLGLIMLRTKNLKNQEQD
jgi:hypothetical protein